MKNLKKAMAVGLAATVVVSAMSVTALAEDDSFLTERSIAYEYTENGAIEATEFEVAIPTGATIQEKNDLTLQAAMSATGRSARATNTLVSAHSMFIPQNNGTENSVAKVNEDGAIILNDRYDSLSIVLTNIEGQLTPGTSTINGRIDNIRTGAKFYYQNNSISYGHKSSVIFIDNSRDAEGNIIDLYSGAYFNAYVSANDGSGTANVSVTGIK